MNDNIYDIQKISELLTPIFEKYGITKAGIIGSYARGDATAKSDVDLMFQCTRRMSMAEWEALDNDVTMALGKDVDLIEFGTFTPRVAREVDKELIIFYDKP